MKTTIATIASVIGIIGALLLVGTATSWFGLVTQRPMAKYAEETRAQVYDTSRQFQQGVNRDIARYCREWASAEGAAKRAVADLIANTLSTYQGELTPANQQCAVEAGAN